MIDNKGMDPCKAFTKYSTVQRVDTRENTSRSKERTKLKEIVAFLASILEVLLI
jgi:hypothetical protein